MTRIDEAVSRDLADAPLPPPVEGLRRRVRQRRTRRVVASLASIIAVAGAASIMIVSSRHTATVNVNPSGSSDQSTLPTDHSALTFREVRGTMPYGASTATSVVVDSGAPTSCHGGALITNSADQTPNAHVVLADRQKSFCYLLGPALLTTTHVGSADAVVDPVTAQWVVNVHFENDDFVNKVANVEINKQIAIIVDGTVQSAPVINPGITGRVVTMSGDFDEATARSVAAQIDPSSARRTPETPTTTS